MKSKFEHSALESDIQRLSQEIKDHQIKFGLKSVDRAAVKVILEKRVASLPPVSVSQNITKQSSLILPAYLQKESPEIQLKVEELIDVAFHKGIDASISEAKKYGSFILDGLHDALTAKLYDELKARKLL